MLHGHRMVDSHGVQNSSYNAPAGHCKRLAPTWKELGEKLAGNSQIKVAFIDCTVHRDVCQKAEASSAHMGGMDWHAQLHGCCKAELRL